MKYLYLLSGGAIGTLARYLVSGWTHKLYLGTFPMGTLVVNAVGSLLIGLVWGLFESSSYAGFIRTFFMIGILGGFTTYSTFSLETMALFKEGEVRIALFNILITNILAILAVFTGYFGIKLLLAKP